MVALRGLLAALAASVSLLVIAVPTEAQRASESFYVGDSIGHIMDGYGLLSYDHIDSVPGRPMEEGPSIIRGWDIQPGDSLTVELGSNNLAGGNWDSLIIAILDEVPDEVCIRWVSPQNFWTPEAGAAFHVALTLAIATDEQCATVVRWDSLGSAELTYDLVHPTYVGSWYLAALIQATEEPLWL